MKPWETKDRKTVLDNSPWLTVEQHTVELPDGQLIPDWSWVITPDYVIVVALTEDERFICFRQVKYGVEGVTLSMVGGYVNEGEEPLGAAQRELLEETGYESPDWQLSGRSKPRDRHRASLSCTRGALRRAPRFGRSRRTGTVISHT